MEFIKKLFGFGKQEPVVAEPKIEAVNEQPVQPKEVPKEVIAPALTPVEQAEKAVAILKAKEEATAPAKVAPVKKSTPAKKKKAPAKK
jgi:hypothetical protein